MKKIIFASILLFAFVMQAYAQTASKPIKLTDAAGRTVEFARTPQRIVVVGRGPFMVLHLLYAFAEGRQRLVGIEQKGRTASDFLPLVDPSFSSKTVLGQNPNTEQIAALKPDLVLIKGTSTDTTSEALKRIGIPSFYLALENPDDYFKDVANIGMLLGNSKRADEIIAFYKTRRDRLRHVTSALQEKDKPRVLLLEYSDRGGQNAVQVPAKSWMQTIEVQTAGGNPVWFEATQTSDGYTLVNFEQIAKWNPDKIFIVVWYTLDPKKVIHDLKSDPKWSSLKAARANEIYAFPTDIFGWDTPEMRWILGMDWLATRIHPDKFKDISMEKEIISFFSQLFGMSETAIRAEILPKVQMDVR